MSGLADELDNIAATMESANLFGIKELQEIREAAATLRTMQLLRDECIAEWMAMNYPKKP